MLEKIESIEIAAVITFFIQEKSLVAKKITQSTILKLEKGKNFDVNT